ncbi:hypothetical protein CCAX7_004180 [Capsulimonas corticalis]|uniref:Uncharacterized protein n=1 Tax=Capsulimonas corticalis TaxID=2219043 RepID=A0A402D2X5_9BACT|nr:helix-turn-helix transcriptional regulator [Capsulimonas corticalis]BDI28367.1 hypothetical protein CCAX7_004180 [Capsulimonas corticalis]
MATSQKEIGELIRARREQLNLSQQDVSNGLEMSRGNYSRLESGQTAVSAADLTEIAAILEIRACYLLGEDTDDHACTHNDDIVRLYRGIRADMQPAARAMMQSLYDQFRREESGEDTSGLCP